MSRKTSERTWDVIIGAYRRKNTIAWHLRDFGRTAGFRMEREPGAGFAGWLFILFAGWMWLISWTAHDRMTLLVASCFSGLGITLVAASQVIKHKRRPFGGGAPHDD